MTAAARLLDRLRDARPAGRGQWRSRCPACDARTSLAIRELGDGRLLVHCHAGCAPSEVLQSVGLGLADLFDQPLGEHRGDPMARPRHDPRALMAAAATDATTAAVIVSAVARNRTAGADEALQLAILAGRLHKFVEIAR